MWITCIFVCIVVEANNALLGLFHDALYIIQEVKLSV